jgi:energy-coupling factor transport system permease protein
VNQAGTLHALAWLAWLAAVVAVLIVTRNPFYLGVTLLWVAATAWAVRATGEHTTGQMATLSLLRFGLFVIPMAALFNALFVHVGTTVIFTLPASWPVVGGPITLEAAVYGALNGLALTGLFAAFMIFNRVVAVRSLIQLTPRAYFPVAVTVAIAVTFAPSTLRQIEQIREAQAIRGRAMRGLGSWLPLFLPLLSSGMERALQLAEAMTARGFASAGGATHDMRTQAMLLLGLLAFGAGWLLRLAWNLPLAGAFLILIGAALFMVAVWIAGRRHPHTTYRPAPWRARDTAVVAAAGVTAACFLLPLPRFDQSTLAYTTYPTLTMPGFSLALGLATWGLLAPALILLLRNDSPQGVHPSTT